jgi:putative methyltransferase (TIGR04325 family)
MSIKIFSGVFDDFNDAPPSSDIYISDLYIQNIKKKLDKSNNKSRLNEGYIIGLIINILLSNKKQPLRVLDFGGGAGETFIMLHDRLKVKDTLIYTVIDNKKIINLGKVVNDKTEAIYFIESLNEYNTNNTTDIIHLGSVIQYLENWKDSLNKLIKLNPQYIVLDDVFTGNIVNYTTMQNYYNSQIRFNFINIDELFEFFNNKGYTLLYLCPFIPVIHGKKEFYDMTMFEKKLRIPYAYNIVFEKNTVENV